MAAAWVLIFIAATVLAWVLIKVVMTFLKISMLGWLDAVAGALFGLAEGLILVLVVAILLMNFMASANFVKKSMFMPRLENLAGRLLSYAPEEARKSLKENGIRLPPPPPAESGNDNLL
jgi:membrane protein required for colicin V production